VKLTLAQKIFRISRAAGQITRNGIDPETGRKYARLEDVLDVVQPLLQKYKLLLTGSLAKSQNLANSEAFEERRAVTYFSTVACTVIRWSLLDLPTGEVEHWFVPGSGLDGGEGHGVALAITASRKAALILIFNLRVADEQLVSEDDAQAKADETAARKIAAAEKRKATIAAKEFVTVTWPEAHNRHKALVSGRTNVMERGAFYYIDAIGKWNEREDGWYVEASRVSELVAGLRDYGCDVRVEGKL